MDAQGTIKENLRLPTDSLGDYAATLPPSTMAVLEATRNWQYTYDLLAEQVDQVKLVHPKEVKAIAAARIKCRIPSVSGWRAAPLAAALR